MMMFTAVAIVRERERGNLELLITTPASSFELMIGKLLPCVHRLEPDHVDPTFESTVHWHLPVRSKPRLAQWIAQVLPLTHFIELVRGIVLRGASLSDLLLPIYQLLGFTALSLAVVTLRFHRSLD